MKEKIKLESLKEHFKRKLEPTHTEIFLEEFTSATSIKSFIDVFCKYFKECMEINGLITARFLEYYKSLLNLKRIYYNEISEHAKETIIDCSVDLTYLKGNLHIIGGKQIIKNIDSISVYRYAEPTFYDCTHINTYNFSKAIFDKCEHIYIKDYSKATIYNSKNILLKDCSVSIICNSKKIDIELENEEVEPSEIKNCDLIRVLGKQGKHNFEDCLNIEKLPNFVYIKEYY